MPDDTGGTAEFIGSVPQYQAHEAAQKAAQNATEDFGGGGGGLFGDSLPAKIGRGLLYMVPIAGQIVDQHEKAVVAQKQQVSSILLNAALKSGDPKLMQAPEIQKAAKHLFGKGGGTFLGVASHIAQHHLDQKQGFMRMVTGHLQAGEAPEEALFGAATDAQKAGLEVPKEAQSMIIQRLAKPGIAAANKRATQPIEVETAGKKAQAIEDVRTDPENVGKEAAAGAFKAGEKTKAVEDVKDPYIQKRLQEHIAAMEKSKESMDDRHRAAEDLLFEKHRAEKAGDTRVPQAVLDKYTAYTFDGQQIDLPPGTTWDQLDQVQAHGGTMHTQSWKEWALSKFSTPDKVPAPPKRTGGSGDPANDYLKSWDH